MPTRPPHAPVLRRALAAPVLALALLALSAAEARAQIAEFGADCSGASGIPPTLAVDGFPVTGQDFDLLVGGPPGGPLHVMIVGFSNTVWGAIPLPFDVSPFGSPGCFLNVSSDFSFTFPTDPAGSARLGLEGWTTGLTVFLQDFVLDFDATTIGGYSRGLALTPLPPTGNAGGELVITEFMKNPNFVGDDEGEWIELYNPGTAPVDIEYWTLTNDTGDFGRIENGGAGVLVPAGAFVTIGRSGNSLWNGGVLHVGVYADFTLSNKDDEIVLSDYSGVMIDRVAYDDGLFWPDPEGASVALNPLVLDSVANDNPFQWTTATCAMGGVPYDYDRGTPGQANDLCTSGSPQTPSGELIFSEVMQNPDLVGDAEGEWLELYNTTGAAIDLTGWLLSWGGGEFVPSSVIVPAGGRALFARDGNPFLNGGLPTPDYVWSFPLFLGNGEETLQLYDPGLKLVARLRYDNGVTFPDPLGASMTLRPDKHTIADSQDGANWCTATQPYGAGDQGTPGTANSCP